MSLFEFDNAFNVKCLCGVDEAGRGPLAGPVVAAAVILNYENIESISDVNDSKKFSEKKREQLYEKIVGCCEDFAVGIVDVDYIEKNNILNATMAAMRIAVESLHKKPNMVIIDGNRALNLDCEVQTIVKGDSKSASIAAASIIAKVTRDRIMLKLDEQFPNYGFKKHKGYATKQHYENLDKFGPCAIHRLSFLKKKLKI